MINLFWGNGSFNVVFMWSKSVRARQDYVRKGKIKTSLVDSQQRIPIGQSRREYLAMRLIFRVQLWLGSDWVVQDTNRWSHLLGSSTLAERERLKYVRKCSSVTELSREKLYSLTRMTMKFFDNLLLLVHCSVRKKRMLNVQDEKLVFWSVIHKKVLG